MVVDPCVYSFKWSTKRIQELIRTYICRVQWRPSVSKEYNETSPTMAFFSAQHHRCLAEYLVPVSIIRSNIGLKLTFRASILAPRSSSTSVALRLPPMMLSISGVVPHMSLVLISAPYLDRTRTMSAFPILEAQCSGVQPSFYLPFIGLWLKSDSMTYIFSRDFSSFA